MGDKIEAKATAKRLGIPVVPGSDGAVTNEAAGASRSPRTSAIPVLIKAAAGGGGRGMKVARTRRRPRHAPSRRRAPRPRPPSATTASTSRSTWRSRATSRSRCSATARATPSIWASATARCSAATRRCWRRRPRPPSTPRQRKKIGTTVAKAMQKLKLPRRRHGRVPLRGRRVLLHRDEHAPAGRASGDRDDHRHRPRHRADPHRLRRAAVAHAGGRAPSRATPSSAASTPRTRATFMPSPGTITYWHPPGGLGVRVDSGVYQGYRIPPYYDSLIGKLIVHGKNRNECLMRLQARASSSSSSTASRPPSRCSATWCSSPTSPTATTTSTGWKNSCKNHNWLTGLPAAWLRPKSGAWRRATTSSSRSRRRCC